MNVGGIQCYLFAQSICSADFRKIGSHITTVVGRCSILLEIKLLISKFAHECVAFERKFVIVSYQHSKCVYIFLEHPVEFLELLKMFLNFLFSPTRSRNGIYFLQKLCIQAAFSNSKIA